MDIKEAAAKAFDFGLSEAIREVEIVLIGERSSEIRHGGKTYSVKHAEGEGHVLSLLTRLRQASRLRRDARVEAREEVATGDRGVARRAKTGLFGYRSAKACGFGGVPLGFATYAPRGSAGSFTCDGF